MGLRWRVLLLLGHCLMGCSTARVMRQETGRGKPAAGEPFEAAPPPSWHSLTRMESTLLALLPRKGAGEREGFAQLEPTLVVDGGEDFGVNVGAPVRLRLWGGEADAGLVRREDWDSLSDFGQWVRALKLGADSSPLTMWVGRMDSFSLLSAHLVRRYSNRSNPDYHPAGAFLTGIRGPLYAEAFASDVLGARLAGAEVALDVEHVLFGLPKQPRRYTLALSAVHDWGKAEGRSPEVTLAHLDGTAVVVVRPSFEMHVLAGWGGQPGEGGAWGTVVGMGADAVTPTLDMKLRLEVRQQHGGFRQGFFGPDYELVRSRVVNTSGLPVAEASFPSGYSIYGEAVVGWDGVRLGELVQRHLDFSWAVEAFAWGRVDMDGHVTVQLFNRSVEVAVRGLAMGMRKPGTRYAASGEVRWRFTEGRLYALGQGGTLLYPAADGTLRPGAFASIGLGVDNAR